MNKRTQVMLVLTVAAIVMLTAGWACSSGSAAKVATISKDFAASVAAAQQAEIAFYNQGKITAQEHQTVETYFLQISKIGPSIDAAVVANDKAGILTALNSGIVVLQSALDAGVGNIKNPDSKAAIQSLLLVAQSALANAKVLVQ